jgi:hypothetical protein
MALNKEDKERLNMALNKEDKELLLAVKQSMIENSPNVERIKKILHIETKLPQPLQSFLDNLGDNPIDVPSLEVKKTDLDSGELFFKYADKIESMADFNFDDFEISTINMLVKKSLQKVNDFYNDKDELKTTELTKNAKVPKYQDLKEVIELDKKADELRKEYLKDYKKITNMFDEDIDDEDDLIKAQNILTDEYYNKQEKIETKLQNLTYKITGVKKSGLTEWEKRLLKDGYVKGHLNRELKTPY